MITRFIPFLFFFIFFSSFAQDTLPKGYFLFPLKPGQPNGLSANMGDLRHNHFHGGLDVKTEMRIGLPVVASADGYVSRIKISTIGYGKVLYLNHPNGYMTVYAHLDHFNETIDAYILKKQYEQKKFDIDITIPAGELNLKKGELLAYAGNTGSSSGPHLHYEIRDMFDHQLNPLLFGFNEVTDTQKPVVDAVAIQTLNSEARVEGEFGRKEFKAVGNTLAKVVKAEGLVGIDLKAHDKMNNAPGSYGIACYELKVNGQVVFSHNVGSYHILETNQINAHLDYAHFVRKKDRFQHAYKPDGIRLSTYQTKGNEGKILIENGKSYQIEITVYDILQNHTKFTFTILGEKSAPTSIPNTSWAPGSLVQFENVLRLIPAKPVDSVLHVFTKGKELSLNSSYRIQNYPVFLLDLNQSYPDSARFITKTYSFDFVRKITPGKLDFKPGKITLHFPDTLLNDTLHFEYREGIDPEKNLTFKIHNPYTPVFGYFTFELDTILPGAGYYFALGKKYEESVQTSTGIQCKSKHFGNYTLRRDLIKPTVRLLTSISPGVKIKQLKFSASDKETGIASFRATLNGKFILMNYEHKNASLWTQLENPTDSLRGEFMLEVTDKVGNVTVFKKTLP